MTTAFREDATTIVRPGARRHLPAIMAFVDAAFADVPSEPRFALRLAVEEACLNVMTHGYGGREDAGPIALRVDSTADGVTVTIADRAPLFRPADAPAADTESGWAEREPGGLGWHLIRSSVDEVRHEEGAGGGNVLTLVKKLTGAAL